ncbi:MAG: hypothetical protein ABI696_03445 [Rubrivivax sp.]
MNAKPPSPPPGTIEFELTDFETARGALDDLPAGVEQLQGLMTPDYWLDKRRAPVPSDRALTGTAIDWLIALPPSLRPKAMSERYPRAVNRLAELWTDPLRRHSALDELMVDRRGHRQGFPPEVKAEIELLRRAYP